MYMMNSDAEGSNTTLRCSLKIEISRKIVKKKTKLEKSKQQWNSNILINLKIILVYTS